MKLTSRFKVYLLTGMFFSTLAHGESNNLVIGSDTWCPYTCEAGKNFNGYSVDLITEALALSNLETSYVNASFDRVVANIKTGWWHLLPATDTSITPELLISKQPVAETSYVFITTSDSDWRYQPEVGLKEERLGIVRGYGYGSDTIEYIETNPTNVVAIGTQFPQRSLLLMLIAGRIDTVLEDRRVIDYWAKQLGVQDQIRIAGEERLLNLMVGVKNEPGAEVLLEKIDQGIIELKNLPKLDALKNKYGFID